MTDTTTTAPTSAHTLVAEAMGTFILVFGVFSTAIFVPADSHGTKLLTVALVHGMALAAGIYAFGRISGGHFNPAVTVGLAIAGRFAWKSAPAYIVAQIVGGVLASLAVLLIGASNPTFNIGNSFAAVSNGAQGDFSITSTLVIEIIATAVFVLVILGATAVSQAAGRLAPLAISLALTFLVLLALPVSNASLNPARSIASAIFGGSIALGNLWVFIVAPLIGAVAAGLIYRFTFDNKGVLTTD